MARQVQAPPAGVEHVFTPAAYGNALEADPVRVRLRYLREGDKRRLLRVVPMKIKTDATGKILRGDDGQPLAEVDSLAAQEWQRALIEAGVVEVIGYTSAAGTPIVTGADLYWHGEPEIVTEVAAELTSGLSLRAHEGKAFGGSSPSSRGTSPNGTAEPAAREDSTSPAAATPACDPPNP